MTTMAEASADARTPSGTPAARQRRRAPGGVRRPKIVVLGMMATIPVPGVVYQTLHYLVGLRRLGFDVFYVEDNGTTPRAFFGAAHDDGWAAAAAWLDRVMRDFDFAGQWCMRARFSGDRHFGLSARDLQRLLRNAALLINLHGGTEPREEHAARGRLVYLETDPVEVEVQLAEGNTRTREYLAAHSAWFTFGENIGTESCGLRPDPAFPMWPTRQPVVLDMWDGGTARPRPVLTTIGNLRQPHRDVEIGGETYHWSKHLEFERFLDLPSRTGAQFELALASVAPEDRRRFSSHGWTLREPFLTYEQLGDYHDFIVDSMAEFTVAKDQNVRLRTAWFSDRSATYLAAGRPVITQDTGFGDVIPTGSGLFAVTDIETAAGALEQVLSRPATHQRAARELAHEHFDSDVVLGDLLGRLDVRVPGRRRSSPLPALPSELPVRATSMWPTTLPEMTMAVTRRHMGDLSEPLEASADGGHSSLTPDVSVIVPVYGAPEFTLLCLESVLLDSCSPLMELIVVDDGSDATTAQVVDSIAIRDPRVSVVRHPENRGFAAAVNSGLSSARGRNLVLLNSDTIVTPGWLRVLLAHLDTDQPTLVGAVTNRTCNEAEVAAPYRTFGELVAHAERLRVTRRGAAFEVSMLAMFCLAGRRDTFESVGRLDEGYGRGMFEDDDYSERARRHGVRLLCAEDVFVHHFGQASLSATLDPASYERQFTLNRDRFEAQWGSWLGHARRPDASYVDMVDRVRDVVDACVPRGAVVLVVSKGDDELVRLPGRIGRHFPGRADGTFSGEYPRDSAAAVDLLEQERAGGAAFLVVPAPASWWLSHYAGFAAHLSAISIRAVHADDDCAIWALDPPRAGEVEELRRLVAVQADLLARTREELASLREAIVARPEARPPALLAVTSPTRPAEIDTLGLVARLAEELGASQETTYELQRARLRREMCSRIPEGATVAVVSRGDDQLLDISGRVGWHLPRLSGGAWGGFHPRDSADAVLRLETLRAMGADHLVLPAVHGWWLAHYATFAEHLERSGVLAFTDPTVGWIWSLQTAALAETPASLEAIMVVARQRGGADLSVLDWHTGLGLAERFPELAVFSPPLHSVDLPYLDATVDLVVLAEADGERRAEAARVAALGVVATCDDKHACNVTWREDTPDRGPLRLSVICTGEAEVRMAALESAAKGVEVCEVLVTPASLARSAKVRSGAVIREVPLGSGRWLERAVRAAVGDVVVVLDEGALPLARCLATLVHALSDTRVDAVAAVTPEASDLHAGTLDQVHIESIGCAIAVRRETLLELAAPGGTDVDLVAGRLIAAGGTVLAHRGAVALAAGTVPW